MRVEVWVASPQPAVGLFTTAALDCALDALPGDNGGRAGDEDLRVVQVDIAPAEIEQFAATGAGECREAVEGEQAVLPCGFKEHPELAGCPHLSRFELWPLCRQLRRALNRGVA